MRHARVLLLAVADGTSDRIRFPMQTETLDGKLECLLLVLGSQGAVGGIGAEDDGRGPRGREGKDEGAAGM